MKRAITFIIFALAAATSVFGQSSAFNYQGRLTETGAASNGTYQFVFKLYDAPNGGNQIGQTLADVQINVVNGIFSTSLDFGSQAFSGADRYLEVSVRKTANDAYTTLTPRQKIDSAPYAVRAAVAGSSNNFNGNLSGDVTGTQGGTVVSNVGGQTAATVASGSQAANNATSANTVNTIVKRDATGKFATAGITFSDGTTLTTANIGGGSSLLGAQNFWTGQNTFNGISLNNTNVTNLANPVSATDAANKTYVDSNFVKFVPGAEQLSVGDANGTAPMINLRGGSTCCSGPGGHTPAWFKVFQNGSFVATGNLGIGVSPYQGKGYRTSWDSYKGAFRSGYADAEWDDANVGFFSWAGGSNSTAIGLYALAFGDTNQAESTSSIVFGSGNQVKGAAGFSAGAGNRVCDTYGVAFGSKAVSGGPLINGKCDSDSFNAGDKPQIGDFDGDGKADLAVVRPTDNVWYFLRTTLGFTGQQWGVAGDIPAPADYDGDGRTGVSVFRPSTGQWFRILSQAGFAQSNWGSTGETPIPADFDGDGKADLAVFRTSNATWYMSESTAAISLVPFGVAEDKPTPDAYRY